MVSHVRPHPFPPPPSFPVSPFYSSLKFVWVTRMRRKAYFYRTFIFPLFVLDPSCSSAGSRARVLRLVRIRSPGSGPRGLLPHSVPGPSWFSVQGPGGSPRVQSLVD